MAVFNSLTFDGENSLDYGVYITGEAVYNAPERAVEMISIPGRNGAIALDQGRFENIEVTYPAGTFGDDQPEFASKIRAFRNALASRFNYIKLTDSYHPDEYRLGLYKSGLTTTPVQRSKAGEFPIVFNCKPQRFLTSGEAEVDGNAWSNVQTGSGSIVTIDNADGDIGFKSLVADIEPIQSGSGTPSPTNVRPISGWTETRLSVRGTNLVSPNIESTTMAGITYSVNADKSITINGTATALSVFYLTEGFGFNHFAKGETYKFEVNGDGVTDIWMQVYSNDEWLAGVTNSSGTFTLPDNSIKDYVRIRIGEGTTVNNVTIRPIIVKNADSASTWEEPQGGTFAIPLARTVYKGILDVVNGLLTVTYGRADIGALNWTYNSSSAIYLVQMPDRAIGNTGIICDTYPLSAQTSIATQEDFTIRGRSSTDTTTYIKDSRYTNATDFKNALSGHYFIYELATPQTYQLTPEEVGLLLGTNNIWADSGDITVQHGKSPVYNPTEFDAKPLIKVVGTGTTVVGDTAITITGTAEQMIYIDCDSMEIYKLNGGTPQSAASLVSFSGNDFPKLKAGNNSVSLGSGISSLKIIPRWWII